MGLFDKIFKRPEPENIQGFFKMLSAYSPVFRSYEGGVYEMELTRAAIHAFATHCSKLKPEIAGPARPDLNRKMQYAPNPYMDTTKFLYRLATIFMVHNTAFIIPLYADDMETITGYIPVIPQTCEIVESRGEPYLRYTFGSGQRASIEFWRVGILTQMQYSSDFFGEDNQALSPTMNLLETQKTGITEGIKQSAHIRFLARFANVLKKEDIAAERARFIEENLGPANNSGVMMFDNKYSDVKQIDSRPFVVDAEQMNQIKNNVYNYFGTNEKILQNNYNEEEFNAFYEGKIEPWAIQLGLTMSNMTFSQKEISFGNQFMFSSLRLQYASNTTKLAVSQQLFDRGILSRNEIREIWQLPSLPDGDKYMIRLEYADVDNLGKIQTGEDEPKDEDG
jgi:hypothetical protein